MEAARRFPPRRALPWNRVLRHLALFGGLGVLAGLGLLAAAFWPSAEVDQYLAASPCRDLAPVASGFCRASTTAEVVYASQTYGRGGNHHHYRLAAGSRMYDTEVDGFLVWIPRWREGDAVPVEIWSGRVTRLGDYTTRESPLWRRQDLERAAAFVALACWLPFAIAFLDRVRSRLVRARRRSHGGLS